MDKNPQTATRVLATALFPLVLAVLLPAALLVGILLYVGGALHGLVQLLGLVRARPPEPQTAPRKPHFLEVSALRVRQESTKHS